MPERIGIGFPTAIRTHIPYGSRLVVKHRSDRRAGSIKGYRFVLFLCLPTTCSCVYQQCVALPHFPHCKEFQRRTTIKDDLLGTKKQLAAMLNTN
ncbi:hypothetical protein [Roseomonas genomospecies 6]|uniref:hypothetical protein n=1 Tax=Roseomonas genomospecies 6 TaxID=214106 RepID=UPI0011F36F65|nr:hypothetical protein [Roseomonas genomospecies 6]